MHNVLRAPHSPALPYSRRPAQPVSSTAHHLSDVSNITYSPLDFKSCRKAALFTRKYPIHAGYPKTRKSLYAQSASHSPSEGTAVGKALTKSASDYPQTTRYSLYVQGFKKYRTFVGENRRRKTVTRVADVPDVSNSARTVRTITKVLSTAGQTTVGAVKTASHAIRVRAASIRNTWRTFTQRRTVQTIIKAAKTTHALWQKRHRFSYSFYAIIFTALTTFEVLFIQWGMYSEPEYAPGEEVDEATRQANSVAGQLLHFVSQMWFDRQYQFLLNLIILAALYITLIFILNRFWTSTAIFGTVMTVYAVTNHIKMESRNEPVLPADLNFITGGNTGELTSFIPETSRALVNSAVIGVIWLVATCIVMQFLDGRNAVIHCSWRHPFASVKNAVGTLTRITAAALSSTLVISFVWGFGDSQYWSTNFAKSLSDSPQIWNGLADSTINGPAVNFLRLVHTKTMDKPEGYSQQAMKEITKKYAKQAQQINQSRNETMTDSTVIMVLSETFSDPTRVPGVSFVEDPMPYIRQLKNETTSGLMLSPGYGGGTANIEYQALTGLSMANYSSTLSVAYQQLVPSLKWAPTLNQAWNEADSSGSTAFHAFNRNMYFRDLNYKKFGFSKFYATDGTPQLTDLHPIDSAWYASDESFYSKVLEQISTDKGNKFYQVVTMQNHMPYEDFYTNNQFKELDTSQDLQDTEKTNIETYTKGISYTDQATQEFLDELNEINRPITVIFYGDHLPGIYPTAYSDPKNIIGLHETDYFIWSNSASPSYGTKLDDTSSAYTSSNYFSAQLASHMNAKVSPYLAFLTQMHQAIPAMSVPTSGGGSSTMPVYLDATGNRIDEEHLSKEAKTLLHDYKLIQYDMSVGKNYLKETGFVDLP
ncbi:LTA synthase family protein [Bifidobacterium dentium]|uniref:LTA synthase family protein n=1 Tax=Bifidobacterium dentium TaxID=1689 RepID=UPI0018C23717|nr:LTA synthase family protein [Bifidobacterium dentium]MBF9709177.1 LTA synthase family protein [Bifidobacterium dentium]